MKNAVRSVLEGVRWRRLLGLVTAVFVSFKLLVLVVGQPYNHEAVFYRVLAVAFGLSFGAQYTRSSYSVGFVPRIEKSLHEALYWCGWGLYFYGACWATNNIVETRSGEHIYGLCWLAAIPPGFLLGCGQPIKGAGRINWWLCEDTFIGWTRGTMRLFAIMAIGYYALSQIVNRIVDPSSTVSWHSTGMMVAVLVNLCHTWLAIPHAPMRATRIVQGAFRTNMNPALS